MPNLSIDKIQFKTNLSNELFRYLESTNQLINLLSNNLSKLSFGNNVGFDAKILSNNEAESVIQLSNHNNSFNTFSPPANIYAPEIIMYFCDNNNNNYITLSLSKFSSFKM